MLQKLSFALACLLILSACTARSSPNASKNESVPPSSSTTESQPPEASSKPEIPSAALTLEQWWTDYLFDAVYRMQNNYDSDNAVMDSAVILEYSAVRTVRENASGIPIKEYYTDGEWDKSLLTDYVKRYFNVELDTLDVLNYVSDDGKTLFLTLGNAFDPNVKPDASLNNEVFTLTEQIENPDGTVALRVTRDDSVLTTYTMAPNGQGGWYFKSVRVDFFAGKTPEQLASVKLTGTYQTAAVLNGWDGRIGSGRINGYGELDGKILLADAPNQSNKNSILRMSLVSLTDLSEIKTEFLLNKNEYCQAVQADGTRIVVQTNQRILLWGKDFSDPRSVAYPDALKALYPETMPILALVPENDLMTYSNERGLALFDPATGKETLLAAHPNTDGGDYMMDLVSFGIPAFLSGGRQISAQIYAYESTKGIFVYDLDTNSGKTLDAAYGWGGPDLTVGNRVFAFQIQEADGSSKNRCLDLKTGTVTEFSLPPEIKYVNAASAGDTLMVLGGIGSHRWQIYRMNMDTLQLEKQDFMFQAADCDPKLVAVSESGAVLLNYYSFETGGGEYILTQG